MHSTLYIDKLDPISLVLYGLGAAAWIFTYLYTVYRGFKYRELSLPFVAVCLNLTWEFYTSYWFSLDGRQVTTMCQVYTLEKAQILVIYFNRVWFFVDVLIAIIMFRYGHRQLKSPQLVQRFAAIAVFTIIAGYAMQASFIACNDVAVTAPLMAWTINVVMSVGFIRLFFLPPTFLGNSKGVAWGKMLGTFLITINYGYISYGHDKFLETSLFVLVGGMVCFILDTLYLYLLYFKSHIRKA